MWTAFETFKLLPESEELRALLKNPSIMSTKVNAQHMLPLNYNTEINARPINAIFPFLNNT